jgi:DNA polymerase-1
MAASTLLLIDGDQYLYRACVSVERVTKWDDENHVLISNEEEAWSILDEGLQDILTHFGTKQHVVALGEGVLGDGKNFRYSVDPNYKSKRAGNRKPMCYANVRARLVDEYNVVTFSNLEADDVLGILATKPGPTDRIIVARDKDLKTIPGKLWDGKNFMQITEVEADYWHMYQTLCGDTTDGYPGCKGVGPKKAAALLSGRTIQQGGDTKTITLWQAVLDAFEEHGFTEEFALTQARLARILRWSDWDSTNKEVILWTPHA